MARTTSPNRRRFHPNLLQPLVPVLALGFLVGCAHPTEAQESPTPLVFQEEPRDTAVMAACNTSLSVVVLGNGLTYQWYYNNEAVPGGSASQLDLVGVTPEQTGGYQVVVSRAGNSITSRVAQVTVSLPTPAPQPIPDPGSLTKFRGRNDEIVLVELVGDLGGTVWGTDLYTDDSYLAKAAVHMGFLAVGERGTMAVKILPGQASYAGSERNGVVSGSYAQWVGSYAPLHLVPTFTLQPVDQAAWVGNPVTFEVQTTSHSAARYQWQHDGVDLPGQTAARLTLPSVTASDAGTYTVIATDDLGANASRAVSLVVVPKTADAPTITATSLPEGLPGQVTRMRITGQSESASVWGTGFYTEDSHLPRAAVHMGILASNETQTVAILWLPGRSAYLTSTRNGVTSTAYAGWRLTYAFLGVVPTVTEAPISQATRMGNPVIFRAAATSLSPVRWQWRRDGVDLPGATEPVLTVQAMSEADASSYDAVASDDTGPCPTPPARLVVVPRHVQVRTATGVGQVDWSQAGTVYAIPLTGAGSGIVWGDGIYTFDSNPSVAVVHAGFLQPDQSATVELLVLGGQSAYLGAHRHNLLSREYGPSTASYAFLANLTLRATGSGLLQIQGPPGQTVQIQATSRLLADPWTLLDTVLLTEPIQEWVDQSDGVFEQRFYRAVTVPNP
jgi:hypothetical protein